MACSRRAARRLRYVNAGHNPPLVVRAPWPRGRRPRAAGSSFGGAALGGTALASLAVSAGAEAMVKLPATGLVLGALAESPYGEESVTLGPGDVVVAYTDGVSEAFSPGGRGVRRGAAVRGGGRARAGCPRPRSWSASRAAVEAWRGTSPAHDDFTLVVARVS